MMLRLALRTSRQAGLLRLSTAGGEYSVITNLVLDSDLISLNPVSLVVHIHLVALSTKKSHL